MNPVRVELMASAVGKIGGVVWHHLFLLAADASGKQTFLRAGPQCLPPERLAGRQDQFGDALEDYKPSPAGPYGVITFMSGAYDAGGVDFDPVAANITLASGAAAVRLWESVQRAARVLGEEKIPYDPVGKGANWAIMEALHRCGVQATLPPKRWAPGASRLARQPEEPGASSRRLGQAVES